MMKHAKNRNILDKMFHRCSKILLVFLSFLLLTCANHPKRATDKNWWQFCPICAGYTVHVLPGFVDEYETVQHGKKVIIRGKRFYCKCKNGHEWFYLNGVRYVIRGEFRTTKDIKQ